MQLQNACRQRDCITSGTYYVLHCHAWPYLLTALPYDVFNPSPACSALAVAARPFSWRAVLPTNKTAFSPAQMQPASDEDCALIEVSFLLQSS
jgi:hypothetical protein